ncbi:LysR family transcriptional regulator [Streptomyces sp. SID3343]|uniref:LysR family transcriptional regulator n=1 Tax=Streptomyces sp. SID3343 TaxID=2690260 RepID=UPI001370399A|nr:LysR family transcriptional regulator [Streptomyces sp. SID3343]MYV97151.1 LysR family transcriptional regulator [Streptomyces sp. SID3343]
MELRHLRTFVAVVRTGTVTDAADALGLAPSSVSAQIRALESSLGVPLFERGPRGMHTTEAGSRLLDRAGPLLDRVELIRHEVAGRPYALRLGALESLVAVHVPRVLARLAERRPQLAVETRVVAGRDLLLGETAAGELDAGLLLDVGRSLGGLGFAPVRRPLAFADLAPVPLAFVAAPTHPLAGRTALTTQEVSGARLLGNVPACSFWLAAQWILGADTRLVPTGSLTVMRAWAAQGLGLALLPEFAVEADLAAGTLARLDLAVPDLSLRLVWRADRESAPGVRDLLYAAAG